MAFSQTEPLLIFRTLCKVLGGQCPPALGECVAAGQLSPLFDMAWSQDVLPALAVRGNEQHVDWQLLGETRADLPRQSLRDNTLRNMTISAQALKLTRKLNQAGITPLLLKGTARLLEAMDENAGFRKQADIDLLVRPEELEAAGNVFLADGYRFHLVTRDASAAPATLADCRSAIKQSAAHHHLPPLFKKGYAAGVELHRHHLPKRFQRDNPLPPLFNSARACERQDAAFLVPSTEHQLIHLILGKLVNDGHFARRSFPVREACDLIELLQPAGSDLDLPVIEQHCGPDFGLFLALVAELMEFQSPLMASGRSREAAANFIRIMHKRYNSTLVSTLLDTSARLQHLSRELAYSPGKLPDYLARTIFAPPKVIKPGACNTE
jgi:hypothetical protein